MRFDIALLFMIFQYFEIQNASIEKRCLNQILGISQMQ